jgi:hypothetical protein
MTVPARAIVEPGESAAAAASNTSCRGLTVNVIRTANTIQYNRTGKPIRSATRARERTTL